jgi:dihydrodipicolinate synthase/N-acetylneuraminate lyase
MERCFSLQINAGCDGLIVCGSLGEGPMLHADEKLAVLKTAQDQRRREQAGAPHD